MLEKRKSFLLFFAALGLTSPSFCPVSFVDVMEFTSKTWGVSAVAAITAVGCFAVKCCVTCAIRCCRVRKIKKKLATFDHNALLEKLANILCTTLAKATEENVELYANRQSTTPCWYVLHTAEHTKHLADSIKLNGGPLHDSVRGIVIIGASFEHPLLEEFSEDHETRADKITTITNRCITDKVPVMVIYLHQNKTAAQMPYFSLAILSIPETPTLISGITDSPDSFHALTTEKITNMLQPTVEAKTIQFGARERNSPLYPRERVATTAAEHFIKRIQGYDTEEV